MSKTFLALASPLALAVALAVQSAQHPSMPPGITHEEHQRQMQRDAELKQRGAAAMGFDQDTTTHHFRLYADGGSIEVTVKNAADAVGLQQVRSHLREIAPAFASGDFAKPLATHGELPPGVPTMQQRKDVIAYAYEDIQAGGRVRLTTTDATALAAVHDFLRYQIREHGTGDDLAVAK